MIDDQSLRAGQYLLQLSDDDLRLLSQGIGDLRTGPDPVQVIRARPELIEDLLGRESSFEAVFGAIDTDQMYFVSPFLLFSVAVHRTARELDQASFVTEWFGPRQRMPVFDVTQLREFLADYDKRLFLAELLSSYTHVASGSMLVSTRRGLRRQRYSELDLTRLASMVETVPDTDRVAIYRRLGDLCLFLTGVFPDHTALQGISAIDRGRLLRAAGLRPDFESTAPRGVLEGDHNEVVYLLERLGARWYRSAGELDRFAPPAAKHFLQDLAHHFGDARRILNVLTDGFLFPWRSRFFGIGSS